MSYQVLARKWRPRSFQQMVGQEHVLRMLTNALSQQRLHHAYLLTGTRGVGKTTLARILAKCLNCETGITATPCETCSICLAIDAGRFLDLFEIDAASRTKVEDTRELLENIHYQPAQGRYKIYLIDEVHMLSGHSFNALLKTLEEPPPYVKFILATTEPKRLPITILSRCLQFHLKHVSPAHITQHLQTICAAETIAYELPALTHIAEAADGSVRDALSLLDQAIAYCGAQPITTADVRQMLGCIEQEILYRLLHALAKQQGKLLLDEIMQLAEYVTDFNQVLEDLLSILHRVSLTQTLAGAITEDSAIQQLATVFTAEDVQLFYQIALIGRRDLPLAPSPQQGFEMVMLRMLAFKPQDCPPILPPPQKTTATAPTISTTTTAPAVVTPALAQSTTVATAKAARAQPSATPNWADMLSQLELTGMAHALASSCSLESLTADTVKLALSVQHQPMHNKKLAERIEQALQRHLKAPIKLEIRTVTNEINTPTKQQQQAQIDRQKAAQEALKNDKNVQKIINTFGATLDLDSIKVS